MDPTITSPTLTTTQPSALDNNYTSHKYPMSSFHPFPVHFISGNISVCNGCKNRYQKSGPPDDICLHHQEWRVYTPQGSSTPQRRFGNVYHHCSVACVQSSWLSFSPASVVVPEDINCKLLAVHKHLLNFNLGVFIP